MIKIRRARQFFMAAVFIAVFIFGWIYPILGFFIPLCMILGIGIGLFKGRKFCDWYCPRGSFYDAWFKSLSPQRKIPALFKNIYFRLGVLLFLMAVMVVNLFYRWPNPINIGMFFVIMMTSTTVLGVGLALFFHQRSWCSFCPVGTIANLAGRNKFSLMINSQDCNECKACAKVCPIQIEPYKFKKTGIREVKDFDCLKCGTCVAACPKKALSF
ncbi:MAG: 4Fe-4S binding protein [Candidatus Omnitrophota bacterium]|nr:4Fe-4S binding protein [Candidatus Omnitrophota bacterium]